MSNEGFYEETGRDHYDNPPDESERPTRLRDVVRYLFTGRWE